MTTSAAKRSISFWHPFVFSSQNSYSIIINQNMKINCRLYEYRNTLYISITFPLLHISLRCSAFYYITMNLFTKAYSLYNTVTTFHFLTLFFNKIISLNNCPRRPPYSFSAPFQSSFSLPVASTAHEKELQQYDCCYIHK
jgi:hypothetical protein